MLCSGKRLLTTPAIGPCGTTSGCAALGVQASKNTNIHSLRLVHRAHTSGPLLGTKCEEYTRAACVPDARPHWGTACPPTSNSQGADLEGGGGQANAGMDNSLILYRPRRSAGNTPPPTCCVGSAAAAFPRVATACMLPCRNTLCPLVADGLLPLVHVVAGQPLVPPAWCRRRRGRAAPQVQEGGWRNDAGRPASGVPSWRHARGSMDRAHLALQTSKAEHVCEVKQLAGIDAHVHAPSPVPHSPMQHSPAKVLCGKRARQERPRGSLVRRRHSQSVPAVSIAKMAAATDEMAPADATFCG